jgi:aryl-alcohol dehydrogenase-like predicted oxidoreductase
MVHIKSVSSRTTSLGSTDIRISRIGTGTNRWALRARSGSRSEDTLEATIRSIAEDHGGSVSQVALSWLLRRDELVIPIPGATKVDHALENAGALDWVMSEAEFNELDEASL